jgi:hypothetical protein
MWCRNESTVATVGESAVKDLGFAFGNGSAGGTGAEGSAFGACAGVAGACWPKLLIEVIPRVAATAAVRNEISRSIFFNAMPFVQFIVEFSAPNFTGIAFTS